MARQYRKLSPKYNRVSVSPVVSSSVPCRSVSGVDKKKHDSNSTRTYSGWIPVINMRRPLAVVCGPSNRPKTGWIPHWSAQPWIHLPFWTREQASPVARSSQFLAKIINCLFLCRKAGRVNYGETWNWDLWMLLASKTKECWAIKKNFFKINPSCSEYRPVHWRASMWCHQSKSMHVSIPFKKSKPDFAAIKTGKSPPLRVSFTC
jgi:hypothetical protein